MFLAHVWFPAVEVCPSRPKLQRHEIHWWRLEMTGTYSLAEWLQRSGFAQVTAGLWTWLKPWWEQWLWVMGSGRESLGRTRWPPGWLARERLGMGTDFWSDDDMAQTLAHSCRLWGEWWDWRLRLNFQFYNHTVPTVERFQNVAQVLAFGSKHPEISLFSLMSHSLLNSCIFMSYALISSFSHCVHVES